MAAFVEITFNQNVDERFANISEETSPPAAANNLDRVVIEPLEVFDGDGSGRWDNDESTFIQLGADSRFNFGDSDSLYFKLVFMLLSDGRYGIVGRRGDANNRWHIILDTDTPSLEFFANDAGTDYHDLDLDFSATVPEVTLGKWHVFEVAFDGTTVRFWLDGVFLGKSVDGSNGTIDSSGSIVEIGRVNEAVTASPTDIKGFDRFIDSIIFDETIPTGLDSDTDHYVRTWTGNTERLELFSAEKTVQPNILDQEAFPNNIADFELAANQCFIAGIEPMRKVDDSEILDVGMDKPGAISFSAGSAGSDYDYVVTWLDERFNESGPSPISAKRDTTTNTIDQPSSPPDQALYWRVYRRHASAGQGLHYLVSGNIDIATTTFADTDNVPSLAISAPFQSVSKPPASNYIAYNNGRMFYANVKLSDDTRHPTRVYFSNLNELEQVDENNWFYAGDNDSEVITGLAAFRGNLIIFKERSVFIAVGDPFSQEFTLFDLSKSAGCVAHQTIKEVNNRLMWLGDEGVYAWFGDAEPVLVSERIEPFFESMPDERKPYATAAIDEELGLYLLSISLESSTENDYILCYNYRDSFQDGQHRWTRWTVPVTSLGEGFIGSGRNARSFFADSDGRVGLFERGLDLSAGIDFKWKTGRFNPWNLGSFMRIHYTTMLLDLVGSGQRRISAGYELNELGEKLSLFENPSSNNIKFRVAGRSQYLSLILSGKDIRDRVRMYGFNIDGSRISYR